MDYADLYAAQNLAIIAFEHNLEKNERQTMINDFFNPDTAIVDYEKNLLDLWLTEERLAVQISAGHVPDPSYVALYPRLGEDVPKRDVSTLHAYMLSARRRIEIRRDLGLYSPRKRILLKSKINEVVSLYDYRMENRWLDD
jgi:hypothetical protein